MPNTRDIRRRIKSVKNTAQITKAMQLVAASKMKRAQDAALDGRPYAVLLSEILSSLGDHIVDFSHPFLDERPVRQRGILVISTDKGLCGALNANLFRPITEIDRSAAKYVAVGRKAGQFLSRSQRPILAEFSISDRVSFSEVRPIVDFLTKAFLEREIDTIEVLYPRFVNTLIQEPTILPLLPLKNLRQVINEIAESAGVAGVREDDREIQFEPGPERILEELLKVAIRREVYQLVLESKASEHSARMVAMKSATDNANNLVDDLTLEYNKVRQASITQEILEIAAATMAAG